MSDDNNIVNNQSEKLAKVSQVTPRKATSFFSTPVFKTISGLIIIFMILGYLGKGSDTQARETGDSFTQSNDQTLKQNLAKLSAMKSAEKAVKEEHEQQKIRAILAARNKPNYTSTPDGKKIGNPAAYRSKPKVIKSGRKLEKRLAAPTTFINIEYSNGQQFKNLTNTETKKSDLLAEKSSNASFLNRDSSVTKATASRITHPDFTLSAGELIEANLETAINSELPGMIRAIVSRDIYSLDASNRLIPKGSKLIGQYASNGISQTQNRILIMWTRVQLPNGVIATLNSPASGRLGKAGVAADSIDRHFVEKFGSSLLFSVLGAYTANAGVSGMDGYNSASQYRMSLVQSFQQTASNTLNKNANIPPTLNIHQGSKVNVFVARDTSFYDILNQEI